MKLPDIGKIGGYLKDFDLASPSWDIFILAFFVVAVFVYGFAMGRNRIVATLIAIYMALAVVANAPFLDGWIDSAMSIQNVGQIFAVKLGLFLLIFAILFFLFSRSSLLLGGEGRAGAWWQVPIFAVLHIGLLLSIALSFLPAESFPRQVFETGNQPCSVRHHERDEKERNKPFQSRIHSL